MAEIDQTQEWRKIAGQSNLTQSQLLIWMGQELNPDAPLYNMVLAWEIGGALDPNRFQRAFQALVQRCDALRLVIQVVQDIPQMRVLSDLVYALDFVDLSHEDKPEAAYHEWLADRVQHRFKLSSRLFDSVLIKIADERFVWYLNQHHLITDGVAVALVYRHMAALYAEDEPEVASPPSFLAYAEYEQSYRESAHYAKASEYWRVKLAEPIEPVRFYHPIPLEPTTQTGRVPCALGRERSQRLLALVNRPGIRALTQDLTVFQIFATALFAYLHRVSDQQQLRIGAPMHNRATAAFKETVGLFMEICPLQLEFEDKETFFSLFQKVAGEMRNVLRYAQPGVTSALSNRSYNVLLNFVNSSFAPFHDYPSRSEWVHAGHGDSAHHLRLQIHDLDETENFVLHFDLNRDLFDQDAQKWVTRHFLTVLDAFLDDPDQWVGGFSLLSNEERRGLLEAFNQTDTPLPPEPTIVQLFERQVEETPDKIAIVDGRHGLSYRTLNEQANRLAHALRRDGVRPDSLVGLCVERSIEAIIGLLGILKAGGGYVPLDPSYPVERLRHMLKAIESPVLLTQQALLSKIPENRGLVICLDDMQDALAECPTTNPTPMAAGHNLAYAIFTSGSTGRPKGVLINHSSLLNYACWAQEQYCGGEPLTFPLFSSLSFDLTVTSLFVPLLSGGSLVVYRDDHESEEPAILRVFAEDRVDIIKLTPAHLTLLAEIGNPPGRLRKLIVGGEDFKSSLAQRIDHIFDGQIEIYNEYGPTEATVGCMVHRFDPIRDTFPSVPIGRPAGNMRIYLLDQHQQPVATGMRGEMYVSGAGVAQGYLKRADLTAERFYPDPFHPGARMYASGDLARWRTTGELEFLGRADSQVKIRGYRIELGEIEAHLLEHIDVRECVAVICEPPGEDDQAFSLDTINHCVRCGLPSNYPDSTFDSHGVCHLCHSYAQYQHAATAYFDDTEALQVLASEMRGQRTGTYDCLALFSGGKDSTYMLYQLVELGLQPLVFTLDNGYISEQAKANIDRVVKHLNLDHVYGTTPHMDAIFADSLRRFSNVCDGCYKTIYTLSLQSARQHGISSIVTGLSRGQLFETRLGDLFAQNTFDRDEIDLAVLDARKAYHRMDDTVAACLDTGIFQTDEIFEEVRFIDFYRYCDVELDAVLAYLDENAPWIRPADTGRSTNCLINDVGIYIHKKERRYHNYALPYSWDVRLGHKKREAALEELDDELDLQRINRILTKIGYSSAAGQDRKLAGYYVADNGLSPSDLRAYLETRLPAFMIPPFLVPLDKMPLTRNGKIDRQALPDPRSGERQDEVPFAPAHTENERVLAQIWSALFPNATIGVHDNFFDLGGDSIISIQIVTRANQAGLRLSPRQIFTHQTIAELALVASRDMGIKAEQGLVSGTFPLTPIQHWFFGQQAPDPNDWSQAVLLETPPDLDQTLAEQALNHLLVQHDALRLCFTHTDVGWSQAIPTSSPSVELPTVTLTGQGDDEWRSAIDSIKDELLSTLDITQGRMFAAALCRRGGDEPPWLLLVVHHLAVDGVSWLPILQDLETAYTQLRLKQDVRLPAKTTSVRQWAEALDEYAQSDTLRSELPYWVSVAERAQGGFLDEPGRNREESATQTVESSLPSVVRVSLDQKSTDALLRQAPRVYNTQIMDLLLTALARTLSAWTGNLNHLIDLEGHGREEIGEGIDLSRSVGWFTAIAPLALCLPKGSDPGDQIKAIKEEIRRIPQHGIGYGLLRHLCRDSSISQKMGQLPGAQVLVNYMGQYDHITAPDATFRLAHEVTATVSPNSHRHYRFEVNLFVMDERLHVDLGFNHRMDDRKTVSALAESYIRNLEFLLEHCLDVGAGGYLPSDFPLAGLDQTQLDQLANLLGQLET